MKWIIEKQYDGMKVVEFLKEIKGFSKRLIISIKYDGGAFIVNGINQKVNYVLAKNDELQIIFPKEKIGDRMISEKIPLAIVYEDDEIIVINKQANMPVIPSAFNPTGTVANGLLYYYKQQNIPYTIHIVTRLDKDTSGLLLVAKHRYSHLLLSQLQRKGQIDRNYVALIEGTLTKKEDTIEAPIGRKEGSIIERTVTQNGKKAVTKYNVLKEYKEYSLVEVKLLTGRTHQIRVHFSYIGHPLLGDDLYGGKKEAIGRQALHCHYLSFVHPFTKEIMTFEAELPKDIQPLL